jgi:hypothetical protein
MKLSSRVRVRDRDRGSAEEHLVDRRGAEGGVGLRLKEGGEVRSVSRDDDQHDEAQYDLVDGGEA